MTSPLRRKRQTTAWNSRPRKADTEGRERDSGKSRPGGALRLGQAENRRRPIAAGHGTGFLVIFGLLGLAASVCAAADDSISKRDHSVVAVSYSSEQPASKLKWVPYRASKVIADSQVVPAGGTVASGEGEGASHDGSAVNLAPAASSLTAQPFSDKSEPNAGRNQGLRPVEPPPFRLPESLSDKALKKPSLGTAPGSILPPPRVDEVIPRIRSQNEGPMIPPLAASQIEETCPTLEQLNLKPINQITSDIKPKGDGTDKLPLECHLKHETYEPRCWPVLTYTWKASGMCHKPLYFDEQNLERYGHGLPPYVQPFVSAAHFFLVVPALPYFMGVYPPNECIYTLGYYRPGSCAPYLLDPLPLSVRGAMFEAGAWTAGVFIIP